MLGQVYYSIQQCHSMTDLIKPFAPGYESQKEELQIIYYEKVYSTEEGGHNSKWRNGRLS